MAVVDSAETDRQYDMAMSDLANKRKNAERAHDLATQLKCPDCEGLSVADSNTSTAGAIRTDISKRVARGQSDAQIRQVYVNLYGESILLSPSSSGIGILVWGLPVLALVLGAVGLVIALRRWQRQPRMQATDADVALVDQARDRAP